MRPVLGRLHRWVGLALAGFLFVSGLTGALIAWNDELDDLLNPHLKRASGQPQFTAAELAQKVERDDPRLRITYLLMQPKAGETVSMFLQPRIDPASGRRYGLDFDQVFVDPANGEIKGRRSRNAAWPISRETLVTFLYRLHHSLHIPSVGGLERLGRWVTGTVALIWAVDCIIGFLLTLPTGGAGWREFLVRLRRSWLVRTGSGYRMNFDLHRATGAWIWPLLLCTAFTGFSVNLYREVFYPALATFSQVTPTPAELRQASSTPIEPRLSFGEIAGLASREAARRGWMPPVGAMVYSPQIGVYQVRYFSAGDERGAPGLGAIRLFYDAMTGDLLGERLPGQGTAADLFVQAQYPVHSGRILGLPGRILISALGLLTAILSASGVAIWLLKRRSQISRRAAV